MPIISRNHRGTACAPARGFTLIEVLVALVVTGIGLLGIAKIQALVFANTGSASTRAIVAIQASGLAATMHANRAYWALGLAPSPLTITSSNTTTTATISDNTLNTTATNAADCNFSGSTVPLPCTPALLAAYDLHTWGNALNALFPGLSTVTTITCPNTIPVNCTIVVTWNEKTVSLNAQSAAGTTTGTFAPTYTLYVEP